MRNVEQEDTETKETFSTYSSRHACFCYFMAFIALAASHLGNYNLCTLNEAQKGWMSVETFHFMRTYGVFVSSAQLLDIKWTDNLWNFLFLKNEIKFCVIIFRLTWFWWFLNNRPNWENFSLMWLNIKYTNYKQVKILKLTKYRFKIQSFHECKQKLSLFLGKLRNFRLLNTNFYENSNFKYPLCKLSCLYITSSILNVTRLKIFISH